MDHGTQATYADPINPAFNAASFQPAYDGQGQWTHTFGTNATNQFIYAGSYYRAIFTQSPDANSVFPTMVDWLLWLHQHGRRSGHYFPRDEMSPSISSWMTSPGPRERTA